jgi:hypothetical protein
MSRNHGHSRCRDWREDRHARRVVGMLEALRRWLQIREGRTS